MTVALVHYHLRSGGVTRVLEAQSAALQSAGVEHIILSGTRYEGSSHLPVVVVPELDYSTDDHPDLSAQLQSATKEALGEVPALWHFHNPTLGKNGAFPRLITDLLESGQRILFQHHDFAEDGRPTNYRLLEHHDQLYPLAPQAHYAFINSRDLNLLLEAGIPAAHCHLLPNAVTAPGKPTPPSTDNDQHLVLYPVRGIRRKNLGELCLLAALAPENTQFALTIAPANPQWRPVYDQWVDFSNELGLPVLFDVSGKVPPAPGADPSFPSWLEHATHLMTCSIAEGFGLAFLEPITLDKPLFGRDLPEITSDFTKEGIALGSLYDDLLVPLDWIDQEQLHTELEKQLRNSYAVYGQAVDEEILDRAWDSLLLGDYADFGNLPESIQRSVIQQALLLPDEVMVGVAGECQPLQDWLVASLQETSSTSPVETLEPYSLPIYGDALVGIYAALLESIPAPPQWIPPQAVLDQFLEPERFHFLRT